MRQWADDLGVPDLTKLLQQFGRNLADQFNCHRVGRITAFDSNTLICKVKLLYCVFRAQFSDARYCALPIS